MSLAGFTLLQRNWGDGTALIVLDTNEDGTVDETTDAFLYIQQLPDASGDRRADVTLDTTVTLIRQSDQWASAAPLTLAEDYRSDAGYRVSRAALRVLSGDGTDF